MWYLLEIYFMVGIYLVHSMLVVYCSTPKEGPPLPGAGRCVPCRILQLVTTKYLYYKPRKTCEILSHYLVLCLVYCSDKDLGLLADFWRPNI